MTFKPVQASGVLRLATLLGVIAGVDLATAVYAVKGLQPLLIALVAPNKWHAGALVPIAYLGVGVGSWLIGTLRRWDTRTVAGIVGVVQLVALGVMAFTPQLVDEPAIRSVLLAACALALGLGGLTTTLFWPYLMAVAEGTAAEALPERVSVRMFGVWGLVVTGILQIDTWLVDLHDQGWESALGLHAVAVLAVLLLLPGLPADEQPRDDAPARTIWRTTFDPVLRPRRHRNEALAFWVSVMSGALLAAMFALSGLLLDDMGETGFTSWIGGAAIAAVVVLSVLQRLMGGRAVLALAMAGLVASALVAVMLASAGVQSGWIVVGLVLFYELGTTACSALVAVLLLKPDERQRGNALLNVGKYGVGAVIAMLAPALTARFDDSLPALILLLCIAAAAALFVWRALTVSREEVVDEGTTAAAELRFSRSGESAIDTPFGLLHDGYQLALGDGRLAVEPATVLARRLGEPPDTATDSVIGAQTRYAPLDDRVALGVRGSRRASCDIEYRDDGSVMLKPGIEGFGGVLTWRIVRRS